MIDLMMLALLLDRPRYGYQLKSDVGAALGGPAAHNNRIYPLLAKFLRARWVRRRTAAGLRGQSRILYTLTSAGRRELLCRLTHFTARDAADDNSFQLRVALFPLLDAAARRPILAARRALLLERRERLKAIAGHFKTGDDFGGSVLRFRSQQNQRELRWLSQLEKQ